MLRGKKANLWIMSCLESFKMMANGVSKFLSFSLQLYYRAISQTSVDFGGPFYTKKGRGKNRHKRSLCSFTCLATREVHLDAVYGLDTDSFQNTFFRIVSPHGLPINVLSDNGTNSIGAKNELQELAAYLEKRCKRTLQAMVINDTSIHPFPLISAASTRWWSRRQRKLSMPF